MEKYYEDREYLNKVYDILENNEFQNMKNIIHRLKNEQFIIVNRNDNICSSCPNLINELCKTFDKVNRFDQKTMELLKLDYQTPYSYIELIEKIKNIVNDEQLFNLVCLDCEWGNICHKK